MGLFCTDLKTNILSEGRSLRRLIHEATAEGTKDIPAGILEKIKEKCTEISVQSDEMLSIGFRGMDDLNRLCKELFPLIKELSDSYGEFGKLPYVEGTTKKFVAEVASLIRGDVEDGVVDKGESYKKINVTKYINDIVENNIGGLADAMNDMFAEEDVTDLTANAQYTRFVRRVLDACGADNDGFLRNVDALDLQDLFSGEVA